jgi:hypothetical protein
MDHPRHDIRIHYEPTPEEITDLIARAKVHALGIDFLRDGALEAVAAAFGVHAFTVDAARRQLRGEGGAPR